MHVDLHERSVANRGEPVHLARLDDEDVAGAGLELLAIHLPDAPSLLDELHLVVGMEVRPGSGTRHAVEQEHRHVHVAAVGADEVVGAASKWQVFSTDSMHRGWGVGTGDRTEALQSENKVDAMPQ